jgi:hypothetical protein
MPAKDKNRKQRWKITVKLKKKRELKRFPVVGQTRHPNFPPLSSAV